MVGEETFQIVEVVPLLEHAGILVQVFFIELYAVQPVLIYFNYFQSDFTLWLIESVQM